LATGTTDVEAAKVLVGKKKKKKKKTGLEAHSAWMFGPAEAASRWAQYSAKAADPPATATAGACNASP